MDVQAVNAAALAPPSVAAEQAARLWPLAKKRAQKRKTLTHAEAAEALGIDAADVLAAAWPIHAWCWLRGMPPLNVVVVPRGKTAAPEGGFSATDYDVFHDALGHTVYTLPYAWQYPWEKVPDPTPEQLAHALAVRETHRQALWDFRFLDLELELRERDAARGRTRPSPKPHATWNDARRSHGELVASLAKVGLPERDLRPGGKGPYPPPRPITQSWDD